MHVAGCLALFVWLVLWADSEEAGPCPDCSRLPLSSCEKYLDCWRVGDRCLDGSSTCALHDIFAACELHGSFCFWDMTSGRCRFRKTSLNSIEVHRSLDDLPTSRPSFTRFPTASRTSTQIPSIAPSIASSTAPSAAPSAATVELPEDPQPSIAPSFSPIPLSEDLKKLLTLSQLSVLPCMTFDAQCPGHMVCFRNTTWWLDSDLQHTDHGFCGCARNLNRMFSTGNGSSLVCETTHDSMWIETFIRSGIAIGEFVMSSVCIYLIRQRRLTDSVLRVITSAIGHALFWLGMSSASSFSWKVLELLCVHLPDTLYKITSSGSKECLYAPAIGGIAVASVIMAFAAMYNIIAEWWYIVNGFHDRPSYTMTPYLVLIMVFVAAGITLPEFQYLVLLVFMPPSLIALIVISSRKTRYGMIVNERAAGSSRRTSCRIVFGIILVSIVGCICALSIVSVRSLSFEQDFWFRPGLWLLIVCEFLFFCIRVDLCLAAYRIHSYLVQEASDVSTSKTSPSKSEWI